jgi:hypothetical protein
MYERRKVFMNFFDQLKNLLRRWSRSRAHPNGTSPEALEKMLRGLEQTRDVEVTCDEVLAVLDQVAEAVLRGEDVTRLMPLVHHHLETCADCREELEALLRILHRSASPAM